MRLESVFYFFNLTFAQGPLHFHAEKFKIMYLLYLYGFIINLYLSQIISDHF